MEHVILIEHVVLLDCFFQPGVEVLDVGAGRRFIESDGHTVPVCYPFREHLPEKVDSVHDVLGREYSALEILVNSSHSHRLLLPVQLQDEALAVRVLPFEIPGSEALRHCDRVH